MRPLIAVIGGVGWQELVLALVIVLLLFGPKRLPEIADAIGKSIRKFRTATRDATDDVKRELDEAKRDAQLDADPERDKP
jgi:TatA/E family protein of Tat protein translocase